MIGVKVVAQRVSRASVSVAGEEISAVGKGLLLLVGTGHGDNEADIDLAVRKLSELRVFSDGQGRMNLSLIDVEGEVLIVSQFTLYADASRGRRPSFSGAGDAEIARDLIDHMARAFQRLGIEVRTGRFGAKMEVELVNDGPVTLSFEIREGKLV